jgi:thiol-disulfide isomerase/thioredoxin
VLLDFWATWCAPCLADIPRLKTLRARYPRTDFEILGISLDATSRRSFISWLNRNRIDWPQVHERAGYGGAIPLLFGIDRLPRTILIARDGSVAAVDLRGERLAAAIDVLVDYPPETIKARK